MNFETVIGLETHAQLQTESKMFCGCSTKFGNDPNSNICPVCTGQPGSLPVINEKAIRLAVKTALALNCKINHESVFARKNYFYPDLPKDYQISQFEMPLAEHGYLEIEVAGEIKKIGITRVHLEEDAGKLVHKGSAGIKGADYSLVDLNRTGTPLMEIVSEPDIRTPEEARIFMEELAHILRYLEVCDAKLEEGSMRCDANISIRLAGVKKLGVKTELKNMNSFKAVQKALEMEEARQKEVVSEGGRIFQQTLLYDEATNSVHPMRSKEGSHDYRYFPDPDLLPLYVNADMIKEARVSTGELPIQKFKRFAAQYGIPGQDINVLIESRYTADFFEETAKLSGEPKLSSNWIIGDVAAYLNTNSITLKDTKLTPQLLSELIELIKDGAVSGNSAKKILGEMMKTGKPAKDLVESMGATQISDESALADIAKKVVSSNPQSVEAYKSGKEAAIKHLIGQAMKETKGRANPRVIEELLKKEMI